MDKTAQHIIDIQNVSKRFGEKTALNNINLFVRKGEFMTILGPSGCGKTTLLRLLAGFETATEGVITISGNDITNLPPYKRNVNTVFQKYALFPHLNVFDNIAFGLKLKNMPKDQIMPKVKRALKMVNMSDYEYRDVNSLSGGQQQRIAIARALVMQPKMMILDEPTSALDISVQAQVLNLLLQLQEELRLTYIIITHDLNVIRYISDRIAVMYMGRLVEYGNTDDVLEKPLHPYTDVLINSVPVTDPDLRSDKIHELPGEPEDLPSSQNACRLCLRCPYAEERCAQEVPTMREETPGHFVECFRAFADRKADHEK